MLDVSYTRCALVGHAGISAGGLSPEDRLPAGHRLTGKSHHVIEFGSAPRRAEFEGKTPIKSNKTGHQTTPAASKSGLFLLGHRQTTKTKKFKTSLTDAAGALAENWQKISERKGATMVTE